MELDHCGICLDLCENALFSVDPVEHSADTELPAKPAQLPAARALLAAWQGRVCFNAAAWCVPHVSSMASSGSDPSVDLCIEGQGLTLSILVQPPDAILDFVHVGFE